MLMHRLVRSFSSSVDAAEINKFSALAQEWWNPHGSFRPLHLMNPARVTFLRNCLGKKTSLQNLRILDVGCGAGIFSHALARLGADVVGIDASEAAIVAAEQHANATIRVLNPNTKLRFRCSTVEEFMEQETTQFDVVVSMEVLEHVNNQEDFLKNCTRLVKKDGGALCLSSINQTWKSYLLGIVAAEYVLRLVPPGTHDWNKFVDPLHVARELRVNGMKVEEVSGLVFNPLTETWNLNNSDRDVNYILFARF